MLISNNFRSNTANKTLKFGCEVEGGNTKLCPELKKAVDKFADTVIIGKNLTPAEIAVIREKKYNNALDWVNKQTDRVPTHGEAVEEVSNHYRHLTKLKKEQQSGQVKD